MHLASGNRSEIGHERARLSPLDRAPASVDGARSEMLEGGPAACQSAEDCISDVED